MQGWSPDFIPQITSQALDTKAVSKIIQIDGPDAMKASKDLAQKEGIFVGISSGATFAGALEVAKTAAKGANILAMLPDTGERYMTTPLFYDISEDMTGDEIEISKSTPSFRFDAPTPPPPEDNAKPKPVTAEANAFLDDVLNDPKQPVAMFAFEWCEFSWSVRKLFAECGIPYRSIDLDSEDYQENDWGGEVRAALNARFDVTTIPQIVVGGTLIGGATETFDAFNEGELQKLLGRSGVAYNQAVTVDPYSLLPSWLHPR
jgi:cysteine synthase A